MCCKKVLKRANLKKCPFGGLRKNEDENKKIVNIPQK